MKKSYTQFLAALETARQFLDAKAALLGPINSTGARKTLDEVTETLKQLDQQQGQHRELAKGQRKVELQLAEAFRRKYLRPVIEIAQAKLPEETELLSDIRLPRGTLSGTGMASRGHQIASLAEPFAKVFVDAGLPATFVADTHAAADGLAVAVSTKGTHRAGRQGATDGIAKVVRKARRAVRVLDAMVKANLSLGEPLVTEWRAAVRVIRGGRSTSAAAVAPVATNAGEVKPAA